MKASQERKIAAEGGSELYWDHQHPDRNLASLWPSLLPAPIKLTPIVPPLTSWDMLAALEKRGDKVEIVPFCYYRPSVGDGVNRKLDNSDWLKGKEPLYGGSLDLCHEIRDEVKTFLTTKFIPYYEPRQTDSLVAAMEMEDAPKVCAQQWKPTGWFLNSPITDAEVPSVNDWHRSWYNRVAKEYARILRSSDLPKDVISLIMRDDDPPDTMTGAPTFVSGARSHEARIAMLKCLKDPRTCTPIEEIMHIRYLSDVLGYPAGTFYSPVVSTRHGPTKKPIPLWYKTGGGYQANYSSEGAYDRTRNVFPAPYYINFLLSPLYVQMSYFRKHKLGLWHDPEHQAEYIEALRKQGDKVFTIDFSGMDTAIFKDHVIEIFTQLQKEGFQPWSCEFFRRIYPMMGITFPSFDDTPDVATFITGNALPWQSGFKLTSELDTFYGMSVLLSCLDKQHPGIFEKWVSGKWVFLELGDDILFTTDFDIDADQLSKDALNLWGAKLKIQRDAMFLKWFIPVDKEIPQLTRSFARFIQQTWYNEDRYDGVEGGTRPNAIMRLALQARMVGLVNHPDFSKWWPDVYSMLLRLSYVAQSTDEFKERLRQGIPSLDEGDDAAILAYSQRNPSYLLNLRARASYEPSAAAAYALFKDVVNVNDDLTAQAIRKVYVDALIEPFNEAIHLEALRQYVPAVLGYD